MEKKFSTNAFMSSLKEMLNKVSDDINNSSVDDILAIAPDLKKIDGDDLRIGIDKIRNSAQMAKDVHFECQKLYYEFDRYLRGGGSPFYVMEVIVGIRNDIHKIAPTISFLFEYDNEDISRIFRDSFEDAPIDAIDANG